jgi:hypothetical protein
MVMVIDTLTSSMIQGQWTVENITTRKSAQVMDGRRYINVA